MESETFESYTKTLQLECERGDQAILNWTVEQETPDLLYYQVYFRCIVIKSFSLLKSVMILTICKCVFLIMDFIFTVLYAYKSRLENSRHKPRSKYNTWSK